MPGKVRVKILAGRNLPVMDRGSDTTDAYVEIKLANVTYKTDVYRKSLNPQWNSDFYRFELDDAELQDEPLQIRLMDHDTYSANDAIGKVNISLNPLLLPSLDTAGQAIRSGKGAVMSGWIPVFDTMHGIRGEVNLIVKVDLFSDVNKFRQSSCGVQFFHSSNIPYGYHAQIIHGFVEELVVNDDPEYQWIDKIRTPRASNEARQVVFLKLSGQVQRKIGLKAIDLGANAVIGYTQCFDLEGDVGVVARGIGTAVTLVKIHESINQPMLDNALLEEQLKYIEFLTLSEQTTKSDSKFDFDAFPQKSGDIVYKILGITPAESRSKSTSIILNKKPKKIDSKETIYEESIEDFDNLKEILEQEDRRGEHSAKVRLKHKMQRLGNSSKNLLNKKVTAFKARGNSGGDLDEMSNSESCTDVSMSRTSPTASLRNSVNDIRGILKNKITGKQKIPRSRSDGVGMANLLVRSLITAPSLDCITEAHDSQKSSPAKSETTKHGSLLNIPMPQSDNNSFLKPMGSNFSISSGTLSSSSGNMDEEDEISESETTQNEIVLVDAETVSMVVKSVLAQEESQNDSNDWIKPADTSSSEESSSVSSSGRSSPSLSESSNRVSSMKNSASHQSSLDTYNRPTDEQRRIIRTGSTRLLKNKKGKVSETQIVEGAINAENLDKFLLLPNRDQDADNWIQPGSTADEPELVDKRRDSMFHELKENIHEKLHNLQDHLHLPHANDDEIKNKHGLLEAAVETMLMEQASLLGGPQFALQNPTLEQLKHSDERRSSIDSLKKRLTSFYKRADKKSELKHEDGLIGTAMRTILMESANLMEEVVVHPLNDPPLPSISLTDLKEVADITKNTYGSAVEIGSIKDNSAQPFSSLTDLKNTDKQPSFLLTALNPESRKPITPPQSAVSLHSPHPTADLTSTEIAKNNFVCNSSNTTNKAFLLAPDPFPLNRSSETISTSAISSAIATTSAAPTPTAIAAIKSTSGHTRAESAGCKMSSPAKMSTSTGATGAESNPAPSAAAMTESNSKDQICRRSSDSDLSVTPKGNSLTTNDRPIVPPARLLGGTATAAAAALKTQINQDNLDMLEYPFLTMSKYPPGFIIHLGATVCARSVKLLERVPNPDDPETRDSWWTELRMEIRSHARALRCNVILGYSEETTISDEVCVLSVTGTAAVINLQFTSGEIGLLNTSLAKIHPPSIGSVTKDPLNSSQERQDFEKEMLKGSRISLPKDVALSGNVGLLQQQLSSGSAAAASGKSDNDTDSLFKEVNHKNTLPGCAMCHIPYNKSSVPFNVAMRRCNVCKHGKVPDVFLATIEIPDSLQITGRGCFLQAQVCRTKKDLKSESNAKEISDGLPFLEYDLHRLLVNKLKIKGMNAIFGLKSTVAIGEKMIALIATGTAVFLSALPAPSVPKIVAGNSWTNPDKLNDLQKSLQETVDRNREIYQLKTYGEPELPATRNAISDTDDSDDETNEIDLTIGNKDTCVLEVDDIEDLEIISLLMEPCPPDGFHVVNTQTVPGLHDFEVVRNLQMFTQIWRAKLSLNQQGSNFPKHFQRLLQTIYFKLRSMIPCAICDLRFRLDLPESEEIQLLVTGMALGLGEPSKLTKYKRKVAAHPQTKESRKQADDELIFSLEEEQYTDLAQTQSLNFPVTSQAIGAHLQRITHQTGSLKLKSKSPTRPRNNSVRDSTRHIIRERYGVDVTPLSYVPGGKIDKYLGNLNFFFIRECTSIRENGGISGFVHSFITELLAVVRAHVTALGGNALVSFYMTELILVDNPHKNQGQCLISVGGDVVFVSYFSDD